MDSTPEFRRLERYRPLLRLQARRLRFDPRLQARFDLSDLVQSTLLKAHAKFSDFRGETEAELVKWLQVILGRVVSDALNEAYGQKRDVKREQRIQECIQESSAFLRDLPAVNGKSPSEEAEQHEMLIRLAAALEKLPEDQRDAVTLRIVWNEPVAEIALKMGRSEKSVAGLILRGRRGLRDDLGDLE